MPSPLHPHRQPSGWQFPVRSAIRTSLALALLSCAAPLKRQCFSTGHSALLPDSNALLHPADPVRLLCRVLSQPHRTVEPAASLPRDEGAPPQDSAAAATPP